MNNAAVAPSVIPGPLVFRGTAPVLCASPPEDEEVDEDNNDDRDDHVGHGAVIQDRSPSGVFV